ARAEIQHLAKEVSSIKEEQTNAIELRNRKVEGAAKPKEVGKSKTSKERDNPTKATSEGEENVEEEPTAHDSPPAVSTPPPVYITAKPQAIVAP
ncbi:hypothetical protein A2U01_0076750, partial [Trifolium medium]|nr:hypothetical protein [Trifolium medium]